MSTEKEVNHINKFNGQNFSLWKLGLWIKLERHGLIKIVTGDTPIPEVIDDDANNAESIEVWLEKDCLARDYIISTIEVSEQMFLGCQTAHQMWSTLSAQHMEHAEDNQYDLLARFYDYKHKPGQDMKTHIAEIKNLAYLLENTGHKLSEKELVTKIMCTLPSTYQSFKSSWRHAVPVAEQSIVRLTSSLLQEERSLAKWNPHLSAVTEPAETAFFVQPSTSQQYHGHRGTHEKRGASHSLRGSYTQSRPHNDHQKTQRSCTYCQKVGHSTAQCRIKKRHERTDAERAALERIKKGKEEIGALAAAQTEINACRHDEDYSLVSSTPRFNTRSTADWFADSGATQHMTDQHESLSNYTSVPEGSWSVSGIGSSKCPVRGYGDVHIWITINGNRKPATIRRVLYVPNLGTNLFSIAAVTDLGWTVTFVGSEVRFVSTQDDLTMTGERIGRKLYLLNIRPRQPSDEQMDDVFPSSLSPGIATWHRRLAHVSYTTIIKMMRKNAASGLDLANNNIPTEPCAGCAYGKHQRSSFPKGRTRATHTGQLIHSDLCGPMEKPTPSGALYFALFIDDFSGWRFISFLRHKSEAAGCFKELVHQIRGETNHLVRTFRTDNGGEWSSEEFASWLNRKGIRHETSAPHTPEQDGVSERGIRTVTEGTRSCLYDCVEPVESWGSDITSTTKRIVKDCRVPLYLWGEAASFAVYTLNRVLNKSSAVTPYEAWHNVRPDVSHLRAFGSIAYVHIPKAERKKLDAKSVRCVFVGYSTTQKAYRFWDPEKRAIRISRDATFDEFHHLASVPDEERNSEYSVADHHLRPLSLKLVERNPISEDQNDESEAPVLPDHADQNTHPSHSEPIGVDVSPPSPQVDLMRGDGEAQTENPRRSVRGWIPRRQWQALPALSATEGSIPIPENFTDAINSPESSEWRTAIDEEYRSLLQNETWELVPCPPGRKPIKSRWTFVIKPSSGGRPPRYKARFMAKGYSQRPGIDFTETYASVVSHDTLRMVMSIIAAMDLETVQLDVKTAFLHGCLEEEIYLEQPEGFVVAGRETEVCHLKKSLYGLKQASRVWGKHFNEFLKSHRFYPSADDPSLFTRREDGEVTMLIIWVDDGIIASNRRAAIDDFLVALNDRFEIRSHLVDVFVGISIQRDRPNRKLYLSQPDYIKRIVESFHMSSCSPKLVPADPNTRLTKPSSCGTQETPESSFPYRQAVGSLLFLAMVTRPDISFAVGQVARFAEEHDQSHVKAVRQIIAYLHGTAKHGICYDGSLTGPPMGYADADWAGCIETRRSTSGALFLLHGGPIAWSSRRQSSIAASTTEAEYVAASEAVKEAVWIRRIIQDIHQPLNGPVTKFCDNRGAFFLAKHPDQRQRTKHIDIRYHFIREKQENGLIDVQQIASNLQLADIFTKPLPSPRFIFLRDAIGIKNVPE